MSVHAGGGYTLDITNLAQTWADGLAHTGLKLNVTDTSSTAGSLLMDLQIGGTSRFSVSKLGQLNNSPSAYALLGGVGIGYQGAGLLTIPSTGNINFASSALNAPDTYLLRDAANTLAQRNGATAQTFNIYNTYTDASNFERAALTWSSNVAYLRAQNAGTGAARLMIPVTGATTVSLLPTAATAGTGARAFVTDATVATFGSAVVGGGANAVPVWSNGTGWFIG